MTSYLEDVAQHEVKIRRCTEPRMLFSLPRFECYIWASQLRHLGKDAMKDMLKTAGSEDCLTNRLVLPQVMTSSEPQVQLLNDDYVKSEKS